MAWYWWLIVGYGVISLLYGGYLVFGFVVDEWVIYRVNRFHHVAGEPLVKYIFVAFFVLALGLGWPKYLKETTRL